MPNKYGKCTRDFGAFLFLLVSTFLYFGFCKIARAS